LKKIPAGPSFPAGKGIRGYAKNGYGQLIRGYLNIFFYLFDEIPDDSYEKSRFFYNS